MNKLQKISLLSVLAILGVWFFGRAFTAHAANSQPTDEVPQVTAQSSLQDLRENLALYRCQFLDCEKESAAVFGDAASDNSNDPLADFSDFQTITNAKFEQQAKDAADLLSLRQYQISQSQLSANDSAPEAPCVTGKCILVIISRQMTYAYEDGRVVNATAVSTGVRGHNTPTGTYHVYGKTAKQKMSGPGYYLPNVPWILWWHGDYSIHGTYWHHNFGHPMSHGCVNMPTPTAKWYFDWAPVGTAVIIRSS